jgi:hypothetical protein
VSKTLYTGLTYTNNLEVQADTDIRGNQESLTREGVVTGLSLIQQSLDYTGGYTFLADASFNKGFDANTDITRLLLSASKLSALSSDWLLRHTLSINRYDNEAIPSTSYNGFLLNSTLGYLDTAGGGSDFSLSLKQEQHDQGDADAYDTLRSKVQFIHYFAHEKNAPYWNLDIALKNNNANDNRRDYDSLILGVNYTQWTLASFKGQIGFNWQQDRYDQRVLLSSIGTIVPINGMPTGSIPMNGTPNNPNNRMSGTINTIEKKRKDNLYALSVQLGKALTPTISLQFAASLGVYDSTINTDSDDFYRLATNLIWRF